MIKIHPYLPRVISYLEEEEINNLKQTSSYLGREITKAQALYSDKTFIKIFSFLGRGHKALQQVSEQFRSLHNKWMKLPEVKHILQFNSNFTDYFFSYLHFSDLRSLSFVSKNMKERVDISFVARSAEEIKNLEDKIKLDFYTEQETKKIKEILKRVRKNLDSISPAIKIFLTYQNKTVDAISEVFSQQNERNAYKIAKAKFIIHGLEQFRIGYKVITFEDLVRAATSQNTIPCIPFSSFQVYLDTTTSLIQQKESRALNYTALGLSVALGGKNYATFNNNNSKYTFFRPSISKTDKIHSALKEIEQVKNRKDNQSFFSKLFFKIEWNQKVIFDGIKESILKMDEKAFDIFLEFLSKLIYQFSPDEKKELIHCITNISRDFFLNQFLCSNLWKSNKQIYQNKSDSEIKQIIESVDEQQLYNNFLNASMRYNNWPYFNQFMDKWKNSAWTFCFPVPFSESIWISYQYSNYQFIINILKLMTREEIGQLSEIVKQAIFDFKDKFFKEGYLEDILKNGFFSFCNDKNAKIQYLVNTYLHTNRKILALLHEYEQIDLLDDRFLLKKHKEAPNEIKQFLIPKSRLVPGLPRPQQMKRVIEPKNVKNRFE